MNGTHIAPAVEPSEQRSSNELAGRLMEIYTEVEPEEVVSVVSREYARFAGSRIRDFIPLFVERNAKAELRKIQALSNVYA
jgi:hypothetical protein